MSTPTGTDGQGQAPAVTGQQQGQAPAAQQHEGQAPQGGQEQGQAPAPSQHQVDPASITDPALRAYVEGLQRETSEARAEAARRRTEHQAAEQAAAQARRAQETEQERIVREHQEAQTALQAALDENRSLKIGSQFTQAATTAGALDPQALLTLVGGAERVTLDDAGKVTNGDALIAEARTKYPWAFSRASADAGAGNGGDAPPAGVSGGMNDFIRTGGRPAAAR